MTLKSFFFGPERRNAPSGVYPRPSIGFSTFPMMATRSKSGQTVTIDTSLELVPVYSAVELLAGAIGSLPLKVYRKGETRSEADGSRQWKMLHDFPNDEMASDEFWEIVMTNLLLWGNAFIAKQRDPLGRVTSLWPIRSSRVAVGRLDLENRTSVRYFVIDNISDPIFESDILQIRGLSPDGLVGYSPIQQARNRLGNEQARDEFQGSFWQNFTFAGGFLKHPNRLSKEAQDRLAEQVKAKAGTLRAGEFMVLEEGLDIQNVTMPLEDAQFVQQANLGRLETALLYRVPPYMLGAETEGSLTYSNAEWQSLDFVKWSLRRWLIRVENSLKRDRDIFPPGGPILYPEFLVDALLRGDGRSRWEQYEIMQRIGVVDEKWIAKTENLPEPPEKPEPPEIPPAVVPSSNGVAQPVAVE